IDEIIRLGWVSITAFRCSRMTTDEAEFTRLFNLGMTSGSKFLDGTKNLTDDEQKKLSANTAMYWNFLAGGPSNDFVLGMLYDQIQTDVAKTTYDRDKSEEKIKLDREYRDASCAAIR